MLFDIYAPRLYALLSDLHLAGSRGMQMLDGNIDFYFAYYDIYLLMGQRLPAPRRREK